MRKFITFFIILGLFSTLTPSVNAQVAGEVLSTDIGALIDQQPIESYNISGYTYVTAEELSGYGFDVSWNASERTLSITRDPEAKKTFMSKDKINRKKSDIVVGQHVYNVYATDIKTYISNDVINAYNVGGQTLIMIDELSRFGYVSYSNESRIISVDMLKYDMDAAYEKSSKSELSMPSDKAGWAITYSGDVKDNQPNGAGKLIKHYEDENRVEDISYTGSYIDGKFDKTVYYSDNIHPLTGCDTRESKYVCGYTYKNGVLDGYTIERELMKYFTRNEYLYDNGKAVWKRACQIDPQYVYGYYITDDGYLDALGDTIDYTKIEKTPKITSVMADGNTGSYAIDENNNLYYFGDINIESIKRRTVPVKVDENIKGVSSNRYELSTMDKLYNMYDKLIKYNNTDAPAIASNVKGFSSSMHIDNDGILWQRPVDINYQIYDAPKKIDTNVKMVSGDNYILYLKDDGSVWVYRRNFDKDSGSFWNDGVDLAKPYKVMDDCKYVNADLWYFAIKNDNSLWTWTSCYYGTPYQGKDSEGILKPAKIADDVAQVGSGNGTFIAYLKTDGSLWVMPDNRYKEFTPIFNSLTKPVKILDNVKTFSCGWSHMLIVKNDGTLWSWGSNAYGQLGDGTVDSRTAPVLITDFYEVNK